MNKIFFLLFSIILTPSVTLASWVKLSPEELIEQTQVAVIGEFIGTTRIVTDVKDESLIVGIIKVKELLGRSVQDDFLLFAIRYEGAPLISTTISFNKGQKGLWLLKQHSPNNTVLFSVSHPQQFIPFNDTKSISHLKKLLFNKKTY